MSVLNQTSSNSLESRSSLKGSGQQIISPFDGNPLLKTPAIAGVLFIFIRFAFTR